MIYITQQVVFKYFIENYILTFHACYFLCLFIYYFTFLVPSPNHKTISDYMDGLLNLELERGGFPIQKSHGASQVATNTINNENKQKYVFFFFLSVL